ncbi:MAG: hypothetical protein ACTHMD_05750 [Flavisolibacter sp.]
MQTQWRVIIEILKKVADIKFQREIWIEHKRKHPLFSFGETVNTLDDYFFFDSINDRELDLSLEDYQAIIRYNDKLLSYTVPNIISSILDDPKWLDIVAETKDVIKILVANTPTDVNEDLKNFYS